MESDCLLPFAEFTYKGVDHNSPNISLFWAKVLLEMRMPFDLLILAASANWHIKTSQVAKCYTQQMMSDLRMLREWLEKMQTRILLGGNKSHRPRDFNVGYSDCFNMRLLPISYANLTESESPSLNSRQVQQVFWQAISHGQCHQCKCFQVEHRSLLKNAQCF